MPRSAGDRHPPDPVPGVPLDRGGAAACLDGRRRSAPPGGPGSGAFGRGRPGRRQERQEGLPGSHQSPRTVGSVGPVDAGSPPRVASAVRPEAAAPHRRCPGRSGSGGPVRLPGSGGRRLAPSPQEAVNAVRLRLRWVSGGSSLPRIAGICVALGLLLALPADADDVSGGLLQPAFKSGVPVELEADSLEYESGRDLYVARGNVRIQQGDNVLTADWAAFSN
ncbi:MAG: hypothetical protein E2O66_02480, partial [Deltaproteobacteria bacterium]